jgi:hypothetical protein
MATAGIQKICVVCGKDVSTQPRVKDGQGRYHCNPCWIVINAPAVPKETPSPQVEDANNHHPPQSSSPIGEARHTTFDDNRSAIGQIRNWRSSIGKMRVLLVPPLRWCGIHADDWADWMWAALLIFIPLCLIVLTSFIILIVIYNAFLPFVALLVIIPTVVVYTIRSSNSPQSRRYSPAARATHPAVLILIAFAVFGGWFYFHSDGELPSFVSTLTKSFVNKVADKPNPDPSQPQQQQSQADANAIADAAAAKQKVIEDARKAGTLRELGSPPHDQVATDSIRNNPDYARARAFLLDWAKHELDEESQNKLCRATESYQKSLIQRANLIGDVSAAAIERASNEATAALIEDKRQLAKVQDDLTVIATGSIPFELLKAVSRDIQADDTVDGSVRDHLRVRLSGR